MTHEYEIRAQEAAFERGEMVCQTCNGTGQTTDRYDGTPMPCGECVSDADDGLMECDACGTMSVDCHTQMTYCGEGTFCPTCLGMDHED